MIDLDGDGLEPAGRDPAKAPSSRPPGLARLFEAPDRLLEAIVAAEVLGPPLALRPGSTSLDRRAF